MRRSDITYLTTLAFYYHINVENKNKFTNVIIHITEILVHVKMITRLYQKTNTTMF